MLKIISFVSSITIQNKRAFLKSFQCFIAVNGFPMPLLGFNHISPLTGASRSKVTRMVGVLLVLFSWTGWAQYDALLHKSYKQNMEGIHDMYQDLIQIRDSVQRAKKAEEIKLFARKHKDRRLELNVDFFLNFWNAFYQKQPKKISLQKLQRQVEEATEENVDFLRARSLRALAEFYWKVEKNYELAFEQYLLLDKELVGTKADDYPEMARDLMQIGEAYYFFHDYAGAKKYFKRAIVLPENNFNTIILNTSRNNLGLCYRHENKLDSSDYYFKKVQQTNFPKAKAWIRIATGNLGGNLYLRKQYDRAIPLLEADLYGAIAVNDYGSAAGSAVTLADIYREKGNIKQAKTFITYAQDNIQKAEDPDRLRLLYPVMSKWHAAAGNIQQSKQYVDSSIVALNRYNEKYSALKVVRAQQKVDRQKEKLQQAAIALERERKAAEKNLLILLIVILCAAMALTYFMQKKSQLIKDLELEKASQELEKAKLRLNRFTERIQEKKKLIYDLKQKLDRSTDAENVILLQLQQSTILTEEDWQDFKVLFEQVHAGFLHRLKEKYPSFSPAEIRFISLAKLNFSTKEMAVALGVSPQSIRTNWYRIRKKLNLSEELTVEELTASI